MEAGQRLNPLAGHPPSEGLAVEMTGPATGAAGPASYQANVTARILVVDDEEEIADSLAEFLVRKEGFRVDIVHDGQQAIDFLKKSIDQATDVDLVLLDMRMPGISGLDVLDWIRGHSDLRYTRVVLLTAAASNDEKV